MWSADPWESPQAHSGELRGHNCFQNNTETLFIFFTDICTYDPKATLDKTTAGNSILT